MPIFRVNRGTKDLKLPPPVPGMENAWRTDSVLAITTDSGPAAAIIPFWEAMLSSEAVDGGRALLSHGEGNNRSLDSPAMAWKPRALEDRQ